MQCQLKLHVQRQLANSMEVVGVDGPNQIGTILFVLKILTVGVDEMNRLEKLEADVTDIKSDIKAILHALTGSGLSTASTAHALADVEEEKESEKEERKRQAAEHVVSAKDSAVLPIDGLVNEAGGRSEWGGARTDIIGISRGATCFCVNRYIFNCNHMGKSYVYMCIYAYAYCKRWENVFLC